MRTTALRWAPSPERLPDATVEALLRQSLARAPGDPLRAVRLAAHLHRCGRFEAAIEAASAPAAAGDAEALSQCGASALALGRPAQGVAWLQAAEAAGAPAALSHLVRAAAAQGDDARAQALCRRALAASAEDHFALAETARRWLAAGRPDRLEALCAELRGRGARNAYVDALWAVAKARLGELAAARRLCGQDRLWVGDGPAGIDLAELAAEILGHANLQPPVPPAATRGGLRIDRPRIAAAPVFRRLDAALKLAVEAYAAVVPGAWAEAPVRLHSWAVVMTGEASQDWHLHPSGRVSGVYYVTAPAPDPATADAAAGALRFGLMPFDPPFDDAALRETVAPRPGRLALFPSSYAHCVAPTHAATPRISVAFDVVPA